MAEKSHRIAVLADTHGLLRPEVTEVLKTCEIILHGGDINNRKIMEQLEQIAPLYAVRGNNDKDWAQGMAEELEITLFGLPIYMVHNKKHRKENLKGTALFIYGHSHKYEEKSEDGVFFLNPGSCGPRRFKQPVTMAVLEVYEDTGRWEVQKIDLTQREEETGKQGITAKRTDLNAGNIKRIVESILYDMAAGKNVNAIADRLGVEVEFVEQVCRIYVIHPGVDAGGIVDKMEVNALTVK
ncbi:MAG: metallophosphatase family protein [Bacteroidales bacterium]|nr:metallophosphatase family protein [Bacteroidales bacterium]